MLILVSSILVVFLLFFTVLLDCTWVELDNILTQFDVIVWELISAEVLEEDHFILFLENFVQKLT